jgi:hypothetical protein
VPNAHGHAPVDFLTDHLVLAAPDVDAFADQFADVTGVTPIPGGAHPGRGTKNYLVRLDAGPGSRAYLELIGPDPSQRVPPERTMFGIGKLGDDFRPHLVTWAVHPDRLDATIQAARAAGLEVGWAEDNMRTAPGGALLSWRYAVAPVLPFDGLQPFLIDWGSSPHPSEADGIGTLVLRGLRADHPDAAALARAYGVLGVEQLVKTRVSPTPALTAKVQGPAGTFILH